MTLDEIEPAAEVFADAVIFIYHFLGASRACRRFLERCDRGELSGVTSVAAMAEVSHRLMMIEAVTRGLVSAGSVAKKLRKKPEVVTKLRRYQENVDRIPLMGVRVLSLDVKILSRASELRAACGLMVNDSILAATAMEAGVEIIATADRDFERVESLTVAIPGDLESLASS